MLVVDVMEVDHVHLESDTRAIWKKQEADNAGDQITGGRQPEWHKEEVNP